VNSLAIKFSCTWQPCSDVGILFSFSANRCSAFWGSRGAGVVCEGGYAGLSSFSAKSVEFSIDIVG